MYQKGRLVDTNSQFHLQVERIIPPTLLSNLRELALVHLDLREFPESMAASLTRLTALNLVANEFDHLPAALSKISNLESLIMAGNDDLQLEDSDLDTLAALPKLRTLDIAKYGEFPEHGLYTDGCYMSNDSNRKAWLQEDVAVIIQIIKQYPKLDMPMTCTTPQRKSRSRF